jgi:enoyl-CoA hydratase/carnithine racemase
MDKILLEIQDKLATITINNPDKLNCIDMEMLQQLNGILSDIEQSQNAGVIVIKGAGQKSFSTGGNLKDFNAIKNFHEVKDWIVFGNQVFNILENLPIPTIAAIQSYAMGGGLELAMACDLRIATENSVFSVPELNHGWVPGWGGLTRLRRLIGESKAKEMIMLGEQIDGEKAYRFGLINKVCDEESLDKLVDHLSTVLSQLEPFVFQMTKKAIMDERRTTHGNDLLYDALATYYSKISS